MRDQVDRLIHRTLEKFGRIDILVNSAGKGHMSSIDVELTDYGTLPRTERKSQRVFDSRITDEIV